MKRITFLLLIAFTTQLFGQNIPCNFSWENAPTTNGNKNFITSIKNQPYQGPCLAFAFNAAIETKYAIENSINNPTLQLSEAYIDYKVWGINNFESVLENGFKIPTKNVLNSNFNTFPPQCNDEFNCHFVNDVRNCINDTNGQKNYSFNMIEVNNSFVIDPNNPVTCQSVVSNSMTVNDVNQISNINSNDDLKLKILNEGPVILKVNGLVNAKKFRNYSTPNTPFSYHAFTIIGWTNDSEWIVKDSWPSMSGITQTKANVDIIGLINSNNVELYQVSGVSYNGGATSLNPVVLSVTDCSPVPVLSNIEVDIDYAFIGGYLYHKFWVISNEGIDNWIWGIDYPNGSLKRSQVNNSNYSSVLLSPTNSGMVTVFVNGYKNGIKVTKERRIYLSNGQLSGRGNGR
ncbi:C1 family peptidase [Tenacibaculum sp. SG-28]|uniref:C1 family peptidase n=1 Tax=Tenacibaculum sp. SG-28 TaxID=754426 RepID=UPI000CF4F902|nr:C1 family peptidase [Tenacibaculum sp. SG-28]PQJ21562.1 hypothetical protein BSU00_05480 [Tenacibaculum sp. SG-28]